MTTAAPPPDARRARFERLVDDVLAPLQRYLRRRASPEVAEDALADTLLVLWRRLDDVPEGDPVPWMYGVARRCLANHQRAGRRHLRLVGRLGSHLPAQPTAAPPADATLDGDPALESALATLGTDDRELLRLWAWEQLEPQEIAVVLGVTANAVSIRLHRIRKRLRHILDTGKDVASTGHSTLGLAEER